MTDVVKPASKEKMTVDVMKPDITDAEIYTIEEMEGFNMEELGEKVDECGKYNADTIELIKSRMNDEVITGYKYTFDYELECFSEEGEPTWVIDAIPVKKQVTTCVNAWKYEGEPLDKIDNIFNDDIDYEIKTLEDVDRLSKQFHGIGMKYALLIYRPKLHESLLLIVSNMQKLQAATDDLHVLSVDFEDSISQGPKVTKGMNDILTAYKSVTSNFPSMKMKLHSKEYIGYESVPETLGTDPKTYEAFGDGSYDFSTASPQETVTLQSMKKLKLAKTLPGHDNCVRDMLIYETDSTSRLATCGDDGSIRLWNFDAGDVVVKWGHGESHVNALATYDLRGTPYLASGSNDGTIKIWNLVEDTLAAELRQHKGFVRTLTMVEMDGTTYLASGSADKTIKLWDLETLEVVMTLRDKSFIYTICSFTDRGVPMLASGGRNNHVKVYDLTNKKFTLFRGHKAYVWDIKAYSSNGMACLASASADGTIKLWNVTENVLIKTLTGHSGIVNSLDLFVSDRSNCLVSGDSKGTVKLWNLSDKKCVKTFKNKSRAGITSVATFNHEGQPIIAIGSHKDIEIWSE